MHCHCDAQTYIARMEHFGSREGLSNQYVTSMVQTPDGVLWVGTRDGLNRFDGFRFTEFNAQNSDLLTSVIGYMHLTPDGMLCIYLCDASTPGIVSHVQYLDPVSFEIHDADESLTTMVTGVLYNSIIYDNGMLCSGKNTNIYSFDERKQMTIDIPDGNTREQVYKQFIQMSSGDHLLIMDIHKPGELYDPA
jgi:ligand-binding sensor domain-containing protein